MWPTKLQKFAAVKDNTQDCLSPFHQIFGRALIARPRTKKYSHCCLESIHFRTSIKNFCNNFPLPSSLFPLSSSLFLLPYSFNPLQNPLPNFLLPSSFDQLSTPRLRSGLFCQLSTVNPSTPLGALLSTVNCQLFDSARGSSVNCQLSTVNCSYKSRRESRNHTPPKPKTPHKTPPSHPKTVPPGKCPGKALEVKFSSV